MGIVGSTARALLPRSVSTRLRERYHSLLERKKFVDEFGYRYWVLSRYMDVSGFLMPIEAKALYDLARSLGPDCVIVEIGSWLGKSASVFGLALRGTTTAHVFCIDPFDASGDKRSQDTYRARQQKLERSLIQQFRDNVGNAGVGHHITPIRGFSHEVVAGWEREIDLLFIDGDHSYDAVKLDFLQWSTFVRPGGYVCFHDVIFGVREGTSHDGPGRVIGELVKHSAAWREVGLFHSLYVARRVAVGAPAGGELG
jgi:MMP 1-O-methyltransferase